MENNTSNYVFKAIEAFHYDLEEAMEALNYALSYDDKNTMALALMGRIYAEKLYNYDEGIKYFRQALAENMNAFEVYEPYINVLLWNEDFDEAKSFIEFALDIKGSDKAMLFLKKAVLYEQLKEYKTALSCIKVAKINTLNSDYMATVKEHKQRIRGKMPKKKKQAKE